MPACLGVELNPAQLAGFNLCGIGVRSLARPEPALGAVCAIRRPPLDDVDGCAAFGLPLLYACAMSLGMRRAKREGLSTRVIAAQLTRDGVPTPGRVRYLGAKYGAGRVRAGRNPSGWRSRTTSGGTISASRLTNHC